MDPGAGILPRGARRLQYLKMWPFSIVGMLASVFVLEMLCMLVGIYRNGRIATITLLIILLVSQMTPHVSPAVNCLLRFTESVVGVVVGIALLWAARTVERNGSCTRRNTQTRLPIKI